MCTRSNYVIHNMWRNNILCSYLIKYSRLYSTLSKAINKFLSLKEQIFPLVGPIGSGKFYLIFDWLKLVLSNQLSKFFKIFINIHNIFIVKCKEKTLNLPKE